MNKHSIQTIYKSEGGPTTIKLETFEGDLSQNVETEIPAGAIDKEVDVSIPFAGILGYAFGCSRKTGDGGTFGSLTVKTNSKTSPDSTFTISATNGKSWSLGDGIAANTITSDITKVFVTNDEVAGNPNTAVANLTIRALNDITP